MRFNGKVKTFDVSCGQGPQPVKWLGHVGIARWDEDNYQGWNELGVPVRICRGDFDNDDMELTPTDIIKEKLVSGDDVYVTPSLDSGADAAGSGEHKGE